MKNRGKVLNEVSIKIIREKRFKINNLTFKTHCRHLTAWIFAMAAFAALDLCDQGVDKGAK
jgi:hypothetical protein